MKAKNFTLLNRGMNRDLSVSKAGESAAYDNRNIRITAMDNGTLLSVTNERGNKAAVTTHTIEGDLVGWNTLNDYLILFTHKLVNSTVSDYIYRLEYKLVSGEYKFAVDKVVDGYDLGFSLDHPIESVTYYESEDIQKIYWVDGIHPLRFANIMQTYTGETIGRIETKAEFGNNIVAFVEKDNSGNTRPNGVVQYYLTYYNLNGQETGFAWISDLIYLSTTSNYGSADGVNNNCVTITLSGLDSSFDRLRLYSVFRSSLNATPVASIVLDSDIYTNDSGIVSNLIIKDDGAHLEDVDYQSLLYIGSKYAIFGTIAYKDSTLFLGDITSVDYHNESFEKLISDEDDGKYKVDDYGYGETSGNYYVTFKLGNGFANENKSGLYPYTSQLDKSSSQIMSFKGGEKYRFALRFQLADGTFTDSFWIGDSINNVYPEITDGVIKPVIAQLEVSDNNFIDALQELGAVNIQLMMAEATYSDRAVLAQGFINPTVFNVWERYNDRLYSQPSWSLRPRNGEIANEHFHPIKKSTTSSGEIQCNYWSQDAEKRPTYSIDSGDYTEEFDGFDIQSHKMIVLAYEKHDLVFCTVHAIIVFGRVLPSGVESNLLSSTIPTERFLNSDGGIKSGQIKSEVINKDTLSTDKYELVASKISVFGLNASTTSITATLQKKIIERGVSPSIVEVAVTTSLVENLKLWTSTGNTTYYNCKITTVGGYTSLNSAFNSATDLTDRWYIETSQGTYAEFAPAFYKKNLMFVDENVVTLHSPELTYGAVHLDNYSCKLRVVGAAKLSSTISDYVVDATPGKYSGTNLQTYDFSTQSSNKVSGLVAWPLWKETGLRFDLGSAGTTISSETSVPVYDRTSYNYYWGTDLVTYWLYIWNKSGKISGFDSAQSMYLSGQGSTQPPVVTTSDTYSEITHKTVAVEHFAYETVFGAGSGRVFPEYYVQSSPIRMFDSRASKYLSLGIGSDTKYYDAVIDSMLTMPGDAKYPILYSSGVFDPSDELVEEDAYLYVADPIRISYSSNPHAIITLGTTTENSVYSQTILPEYVNDTKHSEYTPVSGETFPDYYIPWKTGVTYQVNNRQTLNLGSNNSRLTSSDKYVFIGELLRDFSGNNTDTRYGGITLDAAHNCRYIPASDIINLDDLRVSEGQQSYIEGNRGDTYFQRWDCLMTTPYSSDSVNNVIDITSVMLETHINVDGRADKLRGDKKIASIDESTFSTINPVYSQKDNFITSRLYDNRVSDDNYRSSITWSLDKSDSAEIDAWTHATLANSLKLDSDKGIVSAIRRFGNSLIAFQEKGISEILFNTRTMLSTDSGVPVELANSGKVEGKRYITEQYGCSNKWSITEGKKGLYFVDNLIKAFCAVIKINTGRLGVENISTAKGFDIWFKDNNVLTPWVPKTVSAGTTKNFVSFYDKTKADVYLVTNTDCLVYNEYLDAFTSFFDYRDVLMMTNVSNKFVSFKKVTAGSLWYQNEGFFGRFFDGNYGFSLTYRVAPEPKSDKIWSNIDYRADFFTILDSYGAETSTAADEHSIDSRMLMDGGECYDDDDPISGVYNPNETFDSISVWNEYQNAKNATPEKRFRIWRYSIPRAEKTTTNKYALDRIRNPWIAIKLVKNAVDFNTTYKSLMQLHDVNVTYYE